DVGRAQASDLIDAYLWLFMAPNAMHSHSFADRDSASNTPDPCTQAPRAADLLSTRYQCKKCGLKRVFGVLYFDRPTTADLINAGTVPLQERFECGFVPIGDKLIEQNAIRLVRIRGLVGVAMGIDCNQRG